jgi:hypothetical protein
MTNLLTVKLVTLFTLLVSSLIAGFAPFLINKISSWWERRKLRNQGIYRSEMPTSGPNKTILKIMNLSQGFAGGVLLAGGLTVL